ncbi:acyltransferase family protein [Nocardia thailandica]
MDRPALVHRKTVHGPPVAAAPIPAAAKAGFRGDLEGLRGLAIGLVVVFHVWFGRVSGGVDVFLVLSGFFFTGMLVRHAERETDPRWWPVVTRTLRRLLPSMVVVLAAVLVATVALRPYTQWSAISEQVLTSLLWVQNWELALTWADYLAADPSVSPLQHMWSMSVQVQFYAVTLPVVAVVALACRRWFPAVPPRAVTAALVAATAAASFAYAGAGLATHQGWNYYDSLARAWELLAGAALALALPWIRLPRALRVFLGTVGVAAIVLCGWLILDAANRFPGPAALLPVGAALAVILAGAGADDRPVPTARLLGGPVPRTLGEIAYSLYLWHWPVLIFYLSETGSAQAGSIDGAGIVAVSLALAWATHRWVETPFRSATATGGWARRASRWLPAVLTVAVVAASSAWQFVVLPSGRTQTAGALEQDLYPGAEALASGGVVPAAPLRPTVFEAATDIPPPTADGCIADWDTRAVVTCVYGDPEAERTIALAGSSHAEHWLPALQVLAAERSFRITVYLKMGCPLTLAADAMYKGEANPDCRDWSAEVLDRLAADRPDWVFTTGSRPRDEGGDETPDDYLAVWAALSERGLNVLAVRDTPWLRRGTVRYKAVDCLAGGGDPVGCGMRREDALSPRNPLTEPAAGFPNVFPIDLSDAVCEPDRCPVAAGNVLIYHDEHHLSASYSRSLAGPLGRALRPIVGWW